VNVLIVERRYNVFTSTSFQTNVHNLTISVV